ncbi:GlsB/YeaQ/YmgE family stress response membrane protein [Pseudomarimonas salicorniae]|uniref:GlsB/YeaQ/YmgE family stress response membrane protein n=1 Tax=Pseudomarimonas salicorniae TaxID=2933270 RepID=A0ABT0GEP5_9GAMM|nr:GlsB/YeaQ/YmgE family stress response membrane protein [Lysobacter sp. CAU 1642]MCK7593011.1 GlsB/YeaQ/YmgE family stress response membrane protein [Lysobacter sp. CAU 1642]
MNLVIWLIIGGLIGWLASMVMRTRDQQGTILNVAVGIIGALIGGWFLSPLVVFGPINQDNISIPAMFVSFVGAAILLAVMNLVRGGAVR